MALGVEINLEKRLNFFLKFDRISSSKKAKNTKSNKYSPFALTGFLKWAIYQVPMWLNSISVSKKFEIQ